MDAAKGAKRSLTMPDGNRIDLTIPAGLTDGQTLRLKGKGIKPAKGVAGDQIVTVRIVLPDTLTPEMEKIAESWRAAARHDPRAARGRTG